VLINNSVAQRRAHKESAKTAQGFSLRGVSAFNTLFLGVKFEKFTVHYVIVENL
jgi:hypothetical protein